MATLVNLHQYTLWNYLDLVLGKKQIGSKDEKFCEKNLKKMKLSIEQYKPNIGFPGCQYLLSNFILSILFLMYIELLFKFFYYTFLLLISVIKLVQNIS